MHDRLNIPSVTGTDLEFDIAGPGGRAYAFIIDWHIRFVLATAWYLLVLLFYQGTTTWFDMEVSSLTTFFWLAGLPAMLIYFLYHPVLEIVMDGRTPGKRIAGVRIVTRDGQSPDVVAHLIRNAFRLVDSLPSAYLIGMLTTVFTANNVRFGDLAAGTLLIYDAADEKKALKEVESGFGKQLGLREAELVRELIERWDSLNEHSRHDLGSRLLKQLDAEAQPAVNDDRLYAQLKAHLKEA